MSKKILFLFLNIFLIIFLPLNIYANTEESTSVAIAVYEDMLNTTSVSDMYDILLQNQEIVKIFTSNELEILKTHAEEIYILNGDTENVYSDLVDTLEYLLNNFEMNDVEMLANKITDDYSITSSGYTINSAITIANEDASGEANWTFKNGTLTINKTVTVPSGESLDIIVGSGYTQGTIKAGSGLGTSPMFIVEGTLKIGYSPTQNYGQISINGGTIQINNGGKVDLGEIKDIQGDTAIELNDSGVLNIAGDMIVKGNLKITGDSANISIIKAIENSTTVANTKLGEKLTANGKYLFDVYSTGSLKLDNVTVDGGAKWGGTVESAINRGNTNSGLQCGFVKVRNQTTKDDGYEFSATNCIFKNSEYTGSLLLFFWQADALFSNTIIQDCTDYNGNGLIRAGTASGDAIDTLDTTRELTIMDSTIIRCASLNSPSAGGIIRTNGAVYVNIMLDNINMSYNYSSGWGNVLWNANGSCSIVNSTFTNNTSEHRGGAVSSEGDGMTITNCTFKNNKAGDYGGAVALFPYTLVGKDEGASELVMNIQIGDGCKFENNTAPYGGAIAIFLQKSDSILSTTLNVSASLGESGYMKNNIATIGGGAIYAGSADVSVHLKSKLNLTIDSGLIIGNTAPKGGSVLVDDIREKNTGIHTVKVIGGIIGNEAMPNIADFGGAIAVEEGNFIISNGVINYNKATQNGGAIYVSGGSFTMNGGTFSNNIATQNGGAVYVKDGNYIMSGGEIDSNIAQNGGASYVTGGKYTLNKGTITNNKATLDGGGIYVNKGNFEMTGGIISNNQSTNYGGGIYASSDTQNLNVEILSGSIIGNVASKNGGGLGVNMAEGLSATIIIGLESCLGTDNTHSHPIIQENTANENGGGIWFNGDNMTMNMYCGSIIKNLALLESGSSNIYHTCGTATVYAGEVGEGVMVIGGEYVYVPSIGEKEVYITYNSNIPNNIETKTAQVTVGIEIFLPEKLYVWEKHILIGWSYIENPTEDDEIFSVGTPYKVPDEDVTVYAVWKIVGAGEIVTPVIKSGKYYDEITGEANIMITANSSITAQMAIKDMDPSWYSERILSFDKALPNGTKILMIDKTNLDNRAFYSYKIQNDTTKIINLNSFVKLGALDNYINFYSTDLINEVFLFIIELPKENNITGPTQMTFTRVSTNSEIATIEQKLSFTTTEKREFDFSYEIIDGDWNSSNTINDKIKFKFLKTNPNGEDSRYTGKNLSLVISGNFLEDTKLLLGTAEYVQEADSKFVIPFGNVIEDIEKEITIKSETALENENDINLIAELYSVDNYIKPYLYEKIAKIDNINLSYIQKPAIKLDIDGRVKYADEMGDSILLSYETVNLDESYDVILSVQKKKEEWGYEIDSSLVQSISDGTDLGNGKYKLDLSDSGKIKITFLDNLILEEGTYRVLIKVLKEDKMILEVPYNFIILEKEEA